MECAQETTTRETVQSRGGMDLLTSLPCQSARCVVGLTRCQILGAQLAGPLFFFFFFFFSILESIGASSMLDFTC